MNWDDFHVAALSKKKKERRKTKPIICQIKINLKKMS